MRTISLMALAFFFLSAGFVSAAEVRSEIRIDQDGAVTAKNIRVYSIPEPGKSKFFYGRAMWGNVFIRVTVLATDSTVIAKEYGEKATVFDLKEGDLVDIEGTFPTSADTLNIQAKRIINHSLLKESLETKGTVTAVYPESDSFAMRTAKGNNITVELGSGATIGKGVRMIGISELKKGDTVLSVKGTYDYGTDVLSAAKIVVHQDTAVFKAKNYTGVLKKISGKELPATLVVTIDGKDYRVELSQNTQIMNKARGTVGLIRFAEGDSVRLYGAVRQTDLSVIDAELVRDMNF